MLILGRPALGVIVPTGAVVPEGEGSEVTASLADDTGVTAEVTGEVTEEELVGVDEPEGAAPAPVPGRT